MSANGRLQALGGSGDVFRDCKCSGVDSREGTESSGVLSGGLGASHAADVSARRE